jgi:flavodoxin
MIWLRRWITNKIEVFLMKAVIAYYSQHHGNTKKLLDAIKELGDVELVNVVYREQADLSGFDVIGFASGIYFGKFSQAVIDFARKNLPNRKRVFLINTYGVKGVYSKEMRQVIADKSCELLGTYGCRGFSTYGPLRLIGGIARGRPNENDVRGAVAFFRRMIENRG